MTQIKIEMTTAAYRYLKQAAAKNFRPPNDHARYIILKSLGLVGDDGPSLVQMNNRQAATNLTETGSKAVGA